MKGTELCTAAKMAEAVAGPAPCSYVYGQWPGERLGWGQESDTRWMDVRNLIQRACSIWAASEHLVHLT